MQQLEIFQTGKKISKQRQSPSLTALYTEPICRLFAPHVTCAC